MLSFEKFQKVFVWNTKATMYVTRLSKLYAGKKIGYDMLNKPDPRLDSDYVIKKVPIQIRYTPGEKLLEDLEQMIRPIIIQASVSGPLYLETDKIALEFHEFHEGILSYEFCLYAACPRFGSSLRDAAKNRPLDRGSMINLLRFAIQVLLDLRRRSLVHRDIKPQNILTLESYEMFKMIDFGESQVGVMPHQTVTAAGYTPGYADPDLDQVEKPTLEQWHLYDEFAMGMSVLCVASNLERDALLLIRKNEKGERKDELSKVRKLYGDIADVVEMLLNKKDLGAVKTKIEEMSGPLPSVVIIIISTNDIFRIRDPSHGEVAQTLVNFKKLEGLKMLSFPFCLSLLLLDYPRHEGRHGKANPGQIHLKNQN
jgi:serine/threonine protein kinase